MKTRWMTPLAGILCASLLAACPDDRSDRDAVDAGAERPPSHGHDAHDATDQDEADAGAEPAHDAGDHAPKSDAGKPADSPSDAGKPDPGKPDPGKTDPGKPEPKPSADQGAPSAQHFFLPTTEPDNTVSPRIELDAKGGTHMLYAAYAVGDAYYAYCPKDCTGPDSFKVVRLPTDGTARGTLRLTAAGQPRVLLSTLSNLYYAQCDEQCTDDKSWKISKIADLAGDRDVTGNAFALDPQGHPRFIIHTYLAYLGIGQKTPQTQFAQCDEQCDDAAHWKFDSIATDIWYGSQLRYDASGRAHVATGIVTSDPDKPTYKMGAYLVCDHDCTTEAAWNGIGLGPLFENDVEEVKPSIALALTKAGHPRVLSLAQDKSGSRRLLYFECDMDCAEDHWQATVLSDLDKLGSGLDLALDAQDRARFVFTLDHNIGLHYCEAEHCTADMSPWDLTKVEYAGEVPPDNIILWPNCTVDAWLLHDPTLALASDGSVRVGYTATDISGGVTVTDPTQPACVAGKDMVLSRMTYLKSYK